MGTSDADEGSGSSAGCCCFALADFDFEEEGEGLCEDEAVRLRLAVAAAGAGGAQGAVACGLSRDTDWKAIQSSRWLANVFWDCRILRTLGVCFVCAFAFS